MGWVHNGIIPLEFSLLLENYNASNCSVFCGFKHFPGKPKVSVKVRPCKTNFQSYHGFPPLLLSSSPPAFQTDQTWRQDFPRVEKVDKTAKYGAGQIIYNTPEEHNKQTCICMENQQVSCKRITLQKHNIEIKTKAMLSGKFIYHEGYKSENTSQHIHSFIFLNI